jgi:hypothetical protein
LLRQLGLKADGHLVEPPSDARALTKTLRRVHLISQVCAHWARSDGDTRRSIWIVERALLWSFHRIQLLPADQRARLDEQVGALWQSFADEAAHYVKAIAPHLSVRDGMAAYAYASEGAEVSIVLFEHLGLLASIGLASLSQAAPKDREAATIVEDNIKAISHMVCALLDNNSATSSPRLDGHVIDIVLALLFLTATKRSVRPDFDSSGAHGPGSGASKLRK